MSQPTKLSEVLPNAPKFTAVSLCSGGGGADLGIEQAGGDVRFAMDFSPWAARTYRANFPDRQFIRNDIRNFSNDPGATARLLTTVNLSIGEAQFSHVSTPCQPFSRGSHKGIGNAGRISSHSGTEQTYAATLPFDAASFIHLIRPQTGTFENVPGLVDRYPEYFIDILNAIRYCAGVRAYYCNWKILRADQFGVAQTRPRLFALYIRKDVAESVGIWSDRAVLSIFPRPTTPTPYTVREALTGLIQSPDDEAPFLKSLRRTRLLDLLRQLPPSPERRQRLKNVKSYFTLTRCSWDHPAPTLVIAGQKPTGLSGAIHPELDRKFTIPELKRLFGLPDEFKLLGPVAEAVDTICNMVPPPVQRAIVQKIYDRVIRPFQDSRR